MTIDVHQVPYDSGHRAARMGRGPLHLVGRGRVLDRLRRHDPEVRLAAHETASAFPTEIGTAFELHRALADAISRSVRGNALPLVLSGNCNSAIGTVAGLQGARPGEPLGVVWFDGHGDCDTPATLTGDFLDSMGLSTLTGRCWQALAATIPGFRPVPDGNVVLVGAHGATEGARGILAASGIANVPPAEVGERGAGAALGPALDALPERGVRRVYVHLDVDVLDAERVAPANGFAPTGGLSPDQLMDAVEAVAARFAVAAAAVASFDPAHDRDDRVGGTALDFLERVAALRAGVTAPPPRARPEPRESEPG